ncbi:L-glutamate gamma-semialdehyde dehydrogenase [Geotalea sp. SG265]|uniref:L-glutamate gamma-semialdehyde dehydrogenase n=1 Tax=Geotalea sp. SG265 TaxID=2922867 RepID=UPI001FAE954A|nr:L-glutamate gamma-semialdehyde dehydrogenase [Geotalea sp. SG265]
MTESALNGRIVSCGKEMFARIQGETPSFFNRGRWLGKLMAWSMQDEAFKTALFRFVDVFPALTSDSMVAGHLEEYFDPATQPPALALLRQAAGFFGPFGTLIQRKAVATAIRKMAQQFIIGENATEALRNMERLRHQGFAAVVDVLGEATLSEKEADVYVEQYLQLLDAMDRARGGWKPLGTASDSAGLDWGHAPQINVSVKATALYCLASPLDFEGSVEGILSRLRLICRRVKELNGFLCLDMETYRFKEIVLEVYRRLKLENPDYPHLGVVLQAYLKDTDRDLENLITWARENCLGISIRFVKGAYWDYEMIRTQQSGLLEPVWAIKAETDAAFERHARRILENSDVCHFACASHNIRSISTVIELADELSVPDHRYEFQVLYGMAEPVRKAILSRTGRLRLYCPYGPMIPGMGYLVRRLLENTSNVSFLRQTFVDAAGAEKLLEDPVHILERERLAAPSGTTAKSSRKGAYFCNEPVIDFTQEEQRRAFRERLEAARRQLGAKYLLHVNGKELETEDLVASVNPADPAQVVGWVCQAGTAEVSLAIDAARQAFRMWRDVSAEKRARYLIEAAVVVRRRIYELAALQVLEIGKQWDQAYADVTEAIDFLEYYALEMVRLGKPQPMGKVPGESNCYFYEPKGVAAVIAPWNFPLAISMGMVSAAIVTGNCVVYKPSGLTPVIGRQLVEIFREAGLPAGVFNYIPGRSGVMGDNLVDHPQVSLIAFTGSLEVGKRIMERAARVQPGQEMIKKVVCEMGGKNAIIIDDDADLDEAVPHVFNSAFGFQGQKCSACSRVIVLDGIYDKFVARLVALAEAVSVGPVENPAYLVGAVAEESARQRILEYTALGTKEGRLLYQGQAPEGGYFVPLTIIGEIRPEHRLAQEEVFGPLLAVMRVRDFDEALDWANSTRYALTGGVFSRSPGHLALAAKRFRVGNLYLNRNCTGALVGRQPFGGFKMSGGGTKAGGPDYLLHFMDPRVVTENTMRRGFAPSGE